MSYVFYDSRGYLADGPSIQGLEDLYAWAPDDVRSFIEEGHTKDLAGLIASLEDATADGDVESSRVALLASAREARDVLILNDGVMNEPRTLSSDGETAVHAAADAHVPAIKKLFTTAFKAAAKQIKVTPTSSPTVAIKLAEPALRALAASLQPGLEAALLACLADGGQAGLDMLGLRAAEWEEQKHPRDDHGKWSSNLWGEGKINGPSKLSKDNQDLIDNWAYPDLPNKISYDLMRDPKTEEGYKMTALLDTMPVHNGVTFRGLMLDNPKDVEKMISAKGYQLKLHSPTSKNLDTALTFADAQSGGGRIGQAIIMELHGKGRDISAHLPDEYSSTEEVVATAGTRYKFAGLRHEESQGLKYMRITLKEAA